MHAEYKRRATSQRDNIVARGSRFESFERIKSVPRTIIINAIIKWSVIVLLALSAALSSSRDILFAISKAITNLGRLGLNFVDGAVVPRRLSLVFVQYNSENDAEGSKVIVEKFNNIRHCFEMVSEIQLGGRKFFGVLLFKNKVFVLGGHNETGYLKSVSNIDLFN